VAWAGQTWSEITQEATYGTYNANGATLFPVHFNSNSFTVREVPQRQVIRTADAGNRAKQVVANRKVYQGTLNTLLYPTQAAYWATALTLSSNTIPSYSFAFWDSIRARRYLGGMIQSFVITSSAMQDYVSVSISWIFQQFDSTFSSFSQPAQTNYPTETPYQHVESASNITLAGTAITKYKTATVTIANVLAGTWDELGYISALYYCGRDFNFSLGPQYTATTYRTAYEAQSAQTWVLEWIRVSGSHNITITAETASTISSIDDDLPLDGPGYATVNVQNLYDASIPGDFTITAT
jgi:Phage tail tube protein